MHSKEIRIKNEDDARIATTSKIQTGQQRRRERRAKERAKK